MPRDFVPCLYTDRQLPNAEDDGWRRRLEVIECFEASDRVTQDCVFTMSLDSYAYFLDTVPDDALACEHLFDIFYAAMAALE